MRYLLIFLTFYFLPCSLVQAQQLEQQQRRRIRCPDPITENTISQTRLTIPSLWWAEEKFGSLLLDSWFACENDRRVYLVVNRQIWNALNYIDRYEFVSNFATYVRDQNYNVVVLNPQRRTLATYICDRTASPANCKVWIDTSGTTSFQRQLFPNTSPNQ